jgi:hypothetical protein
MELGKETGVIFTKGTPGARIVIRLSGAKVS